MTTPRIIPAILAIEQADLVTKLAALRPWAKLIHIDIADGQFVPNRTLSLEQVCSATSGLPIELHLMVTSPLAELEQALASHPVRVIVHYEALSNPAEFIEQSLREGWPISIACNPQTSIDQLNLPVATPVLTLLSIEPGFQGSHFLPESLDRLRQLRTLYPDTRLEVDGGINHQTIQAAVAAGAQDLVVGSDIWHGSSPEDVYRELQQIVNTGLSAD